MDHLSALTVAITRFARWEGTLERWGRELAAAFDRGGKLLACGNGGSAAEAQHLTAEFVGRFKAERRPLPAIPLHADSSAATAIGNDYHFRSIFARQVMAHGRPGDVLLCLSTSGRSPNVRAAVRAARSRGLACWALTGPAPNPLAAECADAIAVDAAEATTVQEVHLVAIHMLCATVERIIAAPAAEEARACPRRS
jgi:D-sedoheptulose 7-phosphate isomerase